MRLTLILLISYIVCGIRAQDLNVKAFVEASQDLTARTTPRQDLNGVECALIKVRIVGKDVKFDGNVMGEVEYKGNEYWVYMPNGSKRLKITHPDCLPLDITFGDLGVGKLTGKMTYVLTLTKKEREVKTSDDGYNNDLSIRKLTYEDVAGKSKRELEIMRNMIFARYGYRFKRDDLANYLSKFSWYIPTTSDGAIVYNKMTAIEQYNIGFIKKYEK